MYRIYISSDVSKEAQQALEKEFAVDILPNMPEDELCKAIVDYDAIIGRSQMKITAKVLEAARNLKVIGRAGVGIDGIDVPEATKRGVTVVNTPEANTIAACEHTIALMLSTVRHIPQAHQSIMEGRWDRKKFVGMQLSGKTLGIVGLGPIGSNVAKRLAAFDMHIIAYDPYISVDRAKRFGVELVDLDTLIAQSDFITLHVPLTNETRGMLGKEQFAKMKDGVRIINASRGPVIKLDELAEALKSGKVAGAAIDVWNSEPLKPEDNPFLGMTNVTLTPHLGASTVEAQKSVAVDVAKGVAAALRGEIVASAVNTMHINKGVLAELQPYFELCERIGNIGIYLTDGRISQATVEYTGELSETEVAPLTVSVVKGLLSPILQQTVNFVNARNIAKDRGIEVRELKAGKGKYFTTSITLKLDTDKGSHTITGVLFDKLEAKIVQIDGYHLDFEPKGYLLISPHIDKPGMIGQIAGILGKAGININGMQVGKGEQPGTNMMAVAVDNDIPGDIMLALRAIDGILDLRVINCGKKN